MTGLLFFVFAMFLVIGVVTGILMGRRGHNAWAWGVVGAVLGPLVVPVVILAGAPRERVREVTLSDAVRLAASGGVHVLVGIDGSRESHAALAEASRLFRDARFTFATVVDFDAMDALQVPGVRRDQVESHARAVLDDAARAARVPYSTVILAGRADQALLEYADRHAVDVIAVGARGSGMSRAVLGSVADRLVRAPGAVVLIAGTRDPAYVSSGTRQSTAVPPASGR